MLAAISTRCSATVIVTTRQNQGRVADASEIGVMSSRASMRKISPPAHPDQRQAASRASAGRAPCLRAVYGRALRSSAASTFWRDDQHVGLGEGGEFAGFRYGSRSRQRDDGRRRLGGRGATPPPAQRPRRRHSPLERSVRARTRATASASATSSSRMMAWTFSETPWPR